MSRHHGAPRRQAAKRRGRASLWSVERLESRRLLAAGSPLWAVISAAGSENASPYVTSLVAPAARSAPTVASANAPAIMAGAAGFQIRVVFPDATLTTAQQLAFTNAAARWSQVITGDLPDVTVGGITIDDLEITATAPYIDGPSGILGQAGPTALRSGARGLPYTGDMEFDSADVATMVANGTFQDVILHEMGHVLGLGTLWGSFGLLTGAGTSNPQFIGANAAREYATIFGNAATTVPVENTGGSGTRDGHWRESVFDTELMTGWAEAAGVAMPLSRITVGQFQDLGYTVDYAAADPYQPPGTARSVTVSDVAVAEGNTGTTQVLLTFALSSAATSDVTVQYATVDGTATTANADYVAATGTVTIPAGQTQQTLALTINGDTTVEPNETFRVTLSNPVGATLGRQSATVTITNDDAGTPAVTVADVSVTEGNAGPTQATLTFTLSAAATAPVTVQYATADGTAATADADYVAATGTVTFAVGDIRQTVVLTVNGDTKVEPNETFAVNLSNPVGATLGRPSATVTITDDDGAPPGPPTVTVADVSVREGNAGPTQATLTFTLSAAAATAVTLQYATADGSATIADTDYVAAAGTVTFAAGQTQQTVVLTINGDTKVEPNETFRLTLSNPVGATLARQAATVTILNDDAPPPTVTVADVAVAEGNAGATRATLTFTLSAVAATAVTVQYATADGSATTADADYVAAAGTVTFAAGETRKTVVLTVNGDMKTEPHETFTVTLANPVGATLVRQAATVTINNDDTGLPAVSVQDVSVAEGNAGTTNAMLTFTLSTVTTRPVTFRYATTNGMATTADRDFAAASGIVTFAAGETQKTVTLTVNGDTKAEAAETFLVILSNAVNATLARQSATVTITNDDAVPPLPTVTISGPDSVAEGQAGTRSVAFDVTLSQAVQQVTTVNVALVAGTATAGSDYRGPAQTTLVFSPLRQVIRVVVSIVGDRVVETDETFQIVLSNPVGLQLGAVSDKTVTITNDDTAAVVAGSRSALTAGVQETMLQAAVAGDLQAAKPRVSRKALVR